MWSRIRSWRGLRKQLHEGDHGGDRREQPTVEPDGQARFGTGEIGLGGAAFRDRIAHHGHGRFGLGFVEPGFPERLGGGAGVGRSERVEGGSGHGHAPEAMSARRRPQARIVPRSLPWYSGFPVRVMGFVMGMSAPHRHGIAVENVEEIPHSVVGAMDRAAKDASGRGLSRQPIMLSCKGSSKERMAMGATACTDEAAACGG